MLPAESRRIAEFPSGKCPSFVIVGRCSGRSERKYADEPTRGDPHLFRALLRRLPVLRPVHWTARLCAGRFPPHPGARVRGRARLRPDPESGAVRPSLRLDRRPRPHAGTCHRRNLGMGSRHDLGGARHPVRRRGARLFRALHQHPGQREIHRPDRRGHHRPPRQVPLPRPDRLPHRACDGGLRPGRRAALLERLLSRGRDAEHRGDGARDRHRVSLLPEGRAAQVPRAGGRRAPVREHLARHGAAGPGSVDHHLELRAAGLRLLRLGASGVAAAPAPGLPELDPPLPRAHRDLRFLRHPQPRVRGPRLQPRPRRRAAHLPLRFHRDRLWRGLGVTGA